MWEGFRKVLEDAGHDVIWIGDWTEDQGDEEILTMSNKDTKVIVILDKDFGELAFAHGLPHSGIIRLVNLRAREQGEFCLHVKTRYEQDFLTNAIITVERDRVRIRSGRAQYFDLKENKVS